MYYTYDIYTFDLPFLNAAIFLLVQRTNFNEIMLKFSPLIYDRTLTFNNDRDVSSGKIQ